MKKKSLKAETIKGILTEDAFDMLTWEYLGRLRKMKKSIPGADCGSPCCIAGHIVAAAARLGMRLPSKEAYRKVHGRPLGVKEAAKFLWAQQYGEAEANRLDFYGADTNFYIWEITPEMAVAHILGK
jgi:hypothetical protein